MKNEEIAVSACADKLSLIIARIQEIPAYSNMQNFMFWSFEKSQLIESYVLACSTCSYYG